MRFALLLAGHLGMTLGELGERMTAREFDLWWAYHRSHPIGDLRDDLRTGILASTVANFSGKTLKPGKTMNPSDFMPTEAKPPEEPDPMEYFGAM